MRNSVVPTVLALLASSFLLGCSSERPSSDMPSLEAHLPRIEEHLRQIEEKIGQALSNLPEPCACSHSHESEMAKLSAIETKLNDVLTRESGISPQVLDKLDELLKRLPRLPHDIDTSKLNATSISDLALFLLTDDPEQKKAIALRRVEQSSKHEHLTLESIQSVANEIDGLTVFLNAPELLDAGVVQQVEDARNRLVELLRSNIPSLVADVDKRALDSSDYSEGLRLWAESSAALGFYPSSNDPLEAGKIQDMVSKHDLVRNRIELKQRQLYNLWACGQIRKAWLDFQAKSDAEARIKTCLHFLGPIQPDLLEPASLELYRDFLQTMQKQLPEDRYRDLAEKLTKEERKLLIQITSKDVSSEGQK